MLKKFLEKIGSLGGNTLYYPGCLTKFAAVDLFENYRRILDHMGIDYITIPEFRCCGSPVLNAGYEDDFVALVRDHKEILKKYGVKRVISHCPACVKMFKEHYGMKAEHMTTIIFRNLERFQPGRFNEPICYHDPCHLARGLGITEEPRAILRHLGFEVIEMAHSGMRGMCCGGGGGLRTNNLKLSQAVAKARIHECSAGKIITSCPLCYKQLLESSKDIKAMELSEVLI